MDDVAVLDDIVAAFEAQVLRPCWQAYRAGIPVYTISPLVDNWVVLTLSTQVLPDLDAFARFVAAGGLCEG